MAIAVVDPVLAWRRISTLLHSFSPSLQLQAQMLKSWLSQQLGNPDLQVVAFDRLSSSEVVIADAACKLYAIFAKKVTATATFTKATDSATTSSDTAAEVVLKMAGANTYYASLFLNGLAMASGITMQGNTTADGGTGSALDGANGFVILGAP